MMCPCGLQNKNMDPYVFCTESAHERARGGIGRKSMSEGTTGEVFTVLAVIHAAGTRV